MSRKKGRSAGAKFVPIEKRSAKERRAHYAARRVDWGGISPVTRIRPSGKLYNRKKLRDGGGDLV